jgi:hypothetical protein
MPNLESQPLLPWDYQGGIRIGTTKKVKKKAAVARKRGVPKTLHLLTQQKRYVSVGRGIPMMGSKMRRWENLWELS